MEFETILLGKELINGTTNSSNIHLLISKNIKKQIIKHNNKIYYLFKLNIDNNTIELKQINKKTNVKCVKNIPNNKTVTSFITNSSTSNTSTSYFSSGPSSGSYLNRNSGNSSGSYQFRKEDEGFESEGEGEDFSLNSSEESSSSSVVTNRLFELKNIFTDSANSSGTDSDDINEKINVNIKNIVNYEIYSFNDVIFLHNDAKYPKVLVLIVKINKPQLHINTPLEAILLQFSNYENIKIIFNYYNEIKNKNKYNNKLNRQVNYNVNNNFSLLEKVDLDGITHIEITSNHNTSQPNNDVIESIDYRPSCIISINTPDLGNIETIPLSKISKSNTKHNNASNGKEIDAIIYTESDPNIPTRPERRKKKNLTQLTESLGKTDDQKSKGEHEQNQEKIVRGQFIKVNVLEHKLKEQPLGKVNKAEKSEKHQQKQINDTVDKASVKSDDILLMSQKNDQNYFKNDKRLYSSDHKIYKSDSKFVRNEKHGAKTTKNEKEENASKIGSNDSRTDKKEKSSKNTNSHRFERNGQFGKSLDHRNYTKENVVADNHRYYKSISRPLNYSNVDYNKKIKYRSRSKSPPMRRMPMLSYVPINNNSTSSISNKFFSKLKDLKNEMKSKKTNHALDLASQPKSQFYTELDSNYKNLHISKSTPNLKSALIKNKNNYYFNNNNDEFSEPKKVTFSAYATVQVVD